MSIAVMVVVLPCMANVIYYSFHSVQATRLIYALIGLIDKMHSILINIPSIILIIVVYDATPIHIPTVLTFHAVVVVRDDGAFLKDGVSWMRIYMAVELSRMLPKMKQMRMRMKKLRKRMKLLTK